MAGRLSRRGHRALLFGWRFLPFWTRKIAIRVLYPTFPVGSIAVIRDERGRVLLVHQTYHRDECWGAPGGWLSGRESPYQTATRETFEETGLRVRAGRVLAIGSGPYAELTVAIECTILGSDGFSPSEEIDRLAYFSPRALPPLPANTRRLLEAAFAAQDAWLERGGARPGVGAPTAGSASGAASTGAVGEQAEAASMAEHDAASRSRS